MFSNSFLIVYHLLILFFQKLREDILMMKTYFLTCHAALEEKLLLQLQDRQHFVESSKIYSLQDLIDVSTGHLLSYLQKVHASYVTHITQDCLVNAFYSTVSKILHSRD